MNSFYLIPDTTDEMSMEDTSVDMNIEVYAGKRKHRDYDENELTCQSLCLEETIKKCKITTTPGEIRLVTYFTFFREL